MLKKRIEIEVSGNIYEVWPRFASTEDIIKDFVAIAKKYGCELSWTKPRIPIMRGGGFAKPIISSSEKEDIISHMSVPKIDIPQQGYQQPTPVITLVASEFEARGWEVRGLLKE